MKVYTYYTESHRIMFEKYFKPSVLDLDIESTIGDQECQTGSYYQDGWKKTTMKKVDVFLRPTLSDGASVSVQEALWCGTPVVASDVCLRPREVALFKTGDADDLQRVLEMQLFGYAAAQSSIISQDDQKTDNIF